MGTINPTVLLAGVRDNLIKGAMAGSGEELMSDLYEVVDSSLRTENMAYVGPVPQLKPLVDSVEFSPLIDGKVTATNQDFAAAVEFKRSDIRDDQIDGLMRRAQQFGNVARMLPNQLLISMIQLSSYTGPITYESTTQRYFSATHPDQGAGTTQSNTTAGSGTSAAAIASDLSLALGGLMGYLDQNGAPLNTQVNELAILAPAKQYLAWQQVLKSSFYPVVFGSNTAAAPISNTIFNGLKPPRLYLTPRLSANNNWILFATGGNPSKPFIFFDHEPLQVEVLGPGTQFYVVDRKMAVVASARGCMAPGNPYTAFQVTNS